MSSSAWVGCWPRPSPALMTGTSLTAARSEEHTSELQSCFDLVCRLLLEKKNAAERLAIAQPALSQQIQKLERDTGVELVERTQRRVALTEAGTVFLELTRVTLADASADV